jgi:hypothetical protein
MSCADQTRLDASELVLMDEVGGSKSKGVKVTMLALEAEG